MNIYLVCKVTKLHTVDVQILHTADINDIKKP